MTQQAEKRSARRRRQPARGLRVSPDTQQLVRNRLIESRLTPNAISLTGFALNLAAAALVVERLFFLAGIAFIVGSIMDTLDGRYSRMSGKGTPFGAFRTRPWTGSRGESCWRPWGRTSPPATIRSPWRRW